MKHWYFGQLFHSCSYPSDDALFHMLAVHVKVICQQRLDVFLHLHSYTPLVIWPSCPLSELQMSWSGAGRESLQQCCCEEQCYHKNGSWILNSSCQWFKWLYGWAKTSLLCSTGALICCFLIISYSHLDADCFTRSYVQHLVIECAWGG